MAWRRPANARNVVIPEAGHLVAQEAPVQLGESSLVQRPWCVSDGLPSRGVGCISAAALRGALVAVIGPLDG